MLVCKKILIFCAFACCGTLFAQNIQNPVLPGVADAGVMKYNGKYYIGGVFTNGDFYVSDDLVHWGKPVHVVTMDNGWSKGSGAGNEQIHANDMFCLNEEDAPRASWARYIFGVCREMIKRGVDVKGFNTAFAGDVPLGAGMSSSAALESTYAFALNELFGENKIDKFELAKVGQATEHNYCGVNCGIMDQFASVFGKAGSLIRLDCRSLEYQYFPFHPEGYRLVLMDSVVKHELASSAYNKRRQSCEAAVAAIQKKHPHVEFLRDCTMEMLEEAKADISDEDYMRAEYVIEEIQRVLDVCDALEKDDYETVGKKMYETHHGMSKLYEVSCEELDFLNDCAKEYGVTGSRVMGGGFGGCTINLVKNELYDNFVEKTKEAFKAKFGRSPKVYDVVIGDGSRRLE